MDCIDVLKQGVGKDLTEEQLVSLMEFAKRERKKLAVQNVPNLEDALKKSLADHAQRERIAIIAKKRAAALNASRTMENFDFILNAFADRPQEGLDALISGSSHVRAGARDSVEARQNGLANHYLGGLIADIDALGLTDLLNKGNLDRSIANALRSLAEGSRFDGPDEALSIAKVIRKWQHEAVTEANRAGAWIDERGDYIVAQSHDSGRIRKAGFEAWKDSILPLLDEDKTFDPDSTARKALDSEVSSELHWQDSVKADMDALKTEYKQRAAELRKQKLDTKALSAEYRAKVLDHRAIMRESKGSYNELSKSRDALRNTIQDREEFLYHVWDGLQSGEHLKYTNTPQSSKLSGLGSAAKRLSHERVLHFKSADAWFDYNQQFGMGNLREAVLHGLNKSANSTALMQVLGPNAGMNWEKLLNDVKQHYVDTRQENIVEAIRGKERVLRNRFKEVDGSMNVPGRSELLATVGTVTRGVETMAKLGGVLISSVSDVPLVGTEFAHQGQGFFRPIAEGLKTLVEGKPSVEKLAILSEIGVASEGMLGSLAGKFAGDELPGRMSNALRTYFKLNGLTWWTDAWRQTAGLLMSHGLAARKALDWGKLEPELARTLSLYGIDSGKWDIIRATASVMTDGREYATPGAVRTLPREMFQAYLTERGITLTDTRIRDLQAEIETQLRTYFRDRIDYAVLQPDSKTRATLRQGTSAGTPMGEGLRWFAQFKAFPTAMLQKVWGREIYGQGSDSFVEALKNGHGEWRGMARLVLLTTGFGYAAMSAKQMIQGKDPRNPADYKTWAAAMLQGGALGVYGDFLFGEMRRSRGGGLTSSVLGPAASTLDSIADISGRVKEGDKVSAAALRVVLNHAPGNNLFYFRPVFDHLIGYELFEMLSPGFQKRTVERARKEHGQEFWLKPGSASVVNLR